MSEEFTEADTLLTELVALKKEKEQAAASQSAAQKSEKQIAETLRQDAGLEEVWVTQTYENSTIFVSETYRCSWLAETPLKKSGTQETRCTSWQVAGVRSGPAARLHCYARAS